MNLSVLNTMCTVTLNAPFAIRCITNLRIVRRLKNFPRERNKKTIKLL
jgi:hypothetical protein